MSKIVHLRIYRKLLPELGRTKTLEVRVGYPHIREIEVGDVLRYNGDSGHDQRAMAIRTYDSLKAMLVQEDHHRIYPFADVDLISFLRRLFPPNKEKLGVYVFELQSAHRV